MTRYIYNTDDNDGDDNDNDGLDDGDDDKALTKQMEHLHPDRKFRIRTDEYKRFLQPNVCPAAERDMLMVMMMMHSAYGTFTSTWKQRRGEKRNVCEW